MDANDLNKLINKQSVQEALNWFQNPANGRSSFLQNAFKNLGGTGLSLGGAIAASQPIRDTYRYIKSLGDYATVANKNRVFSGKTDKDIIRDFNSLYFDQANHRNLGDKVIKKLAQKSGLYGDIPAPVIGSDNLNLKEVPPATKQEQEAMAKADALLSLPPSNDNISDINIERIIPTLDNGGVTPIAPQAPVGKTVEGQPTGYAANMTLEDLINMAQAVKQQQNQVNTDYIAELEGALQNTRDNNRRAFMRDLAVASLAGLTGNKTYGGLIGRYNPQTEVSNRIALQKALMDARQGQIFDPTPILSNAVLMQQLGIPETAAMADKAAMNMYGNVYRTQQGAENLAKRLDVQQAIENAKLQAKQEMFQKQMDERIREFNNPRYNDLAAKASMVGSILNQAQLDPRMRQMITPAFIEYAMKLTGYEQPQQAQQTSGTVDIGR